MKFKDSRTTRLPWEVHNMMDILLKSFWCTKDYLKFHYHMKALEDYFPNPHNSFRVCLKLADIGVKRTWRGRPGQGATAVADIWEVILASYWDHLGQIHLERAVSNEHRNSFGWLCSVITFQFQNWEHVELESINLNVKNNNILPVLLFEKRSRKWPLLTLSTVNLWVYLTRPAMSRYVPRG